MNIKLFLTGIYSTLFLTVTCSENNKDIEDLSMIVRHFSARMASYSIAPQYGTTDNFAFSGLRVVSTLLTMHDLGSNYMRAEVENMLGLTSSLIDNGCDIMNELTKYETIEESCFGVHFKSTLFYRETMSVNQNKIKGPCIGGQAQALNFANKYNAMDTINEWYDSEDIFFKYYLSGPLNETTNELFMNRLRMQIVMDNDFNISQQINFNNIKENQVEVNSMEKIGMFSYRHYRDRDVFLIREDFPGDRFSSLVILPNYQTTDYENTLKSLFEAESFSNILLEAVSISEKTKMLLRMPEIQVRTRADIKKVLGNIGLRSIDRTDILSELTSQPSNLFQFPHSEFIKVFAPKAGIDNYEGLSPFLVDKPFIFVILDKKFSVPMKVVVYTGLEKFSRD